MALPNLEGRTPIHAGRGPGLTRRVLGQRGGSHEVSLTENHVPPHTHTGMMAVSDEATTSRASTTVALAKTENASYCSPSVGGGRDSSKAFVCTGEATSGYVHNNMQPFISMNYVIALQGLYPSRS